MRSVKILLACSFVLVAAAVTAIQSSVPKTARRQVQNTALQAPGATLLADGGDPLPRPKTPVLIADGGDPLPRPKPSAFADGGDPLPRPKPSVLVADGGDPLPRPTPPASV